MENIKKLFLNKEDNNLINKNIFFFLVITAYLFLLLLLLFKIINKFFLNSFNNLKLFNTEQEEFIDWNQ